MNESHHQIGVIRSKQQKMARIVPSYSPRRMEDLDFGYLEDLNRKRMFQMIRMGFGERMNQQLHTYNKIPVLPNKRKKIQSASIKALQKKVHEILSRDDTPKITQHLSHRVIEDPYQMECTKHKMLGQQIEQSQSNKQENFRQINYQMSQSSGELPWIDHNRSLFASQVKKKQAEVEAQKIVNRIAQLRMEHEKLIKKINQQDQKAEEIYMHRLQLQMKKEEKMKQKKEQPPPFSLQVSRSQKQTLDKIKEENLLRKKTEAKLFRELLKKDHNEILNQRSMDHETYRAKVIQVKEEEKQSNLNTLQKLREKRERVRVDMAYEKDRVLKEKVEYDRMIAELEREEQMELLRLKQTMDRQNQINQKIDEAHKLPPKEYEKVYKNNADKNSQHQSQTQ